MNDTRIAHAGFPRVYTKKSLRKGLGMSLFAATPMKRGETIFIGKGNLVFAPPDGTAEESATLPNSIGIDQNHWLVAFEGNPMHNINHSCDPNTGIRGKVTFVALCNIKKDEEIFIDYSITECDPDWVMGDWETEKPIKCSCGEVACRGIIRSIIFLPKKIYNKYLPFIPTIFQRIYEKKHR